MSAAIDYTKHWDEKFRSRAWGRYPPEDLVRFIGRHFKSGDRAATKILEIGCGPGANVWFLHREGYRVSAIDGSEAGIEIAKNRLDHENRGLTTIAADFRVGNFCELPWDDGQFDAVIDVFALYANTNDVIDRTLEQVHRVLKPGGLFYSKLWGTETTGFGAGKALESSTFDDIVSGPCHQMGVSHFFSKEEIIKRFGKWFKVIAIDRVLRSDTIANQQAEEFHCQFQKAF